MGLTREDIDLLNRSGYWQCKTVGCYRIDARKRDKKPKYCDWCSGTEFVHVDMLRDANERR